MKIKRDFSPDGNISMERVINQLFLYFIFILNSNNQQSHLDNTTNSTELAQ
jgi:hypothetical protein